MKSKYKFAELADKFVAFYHSLRISQITTMKDQAEHYVDLKEFVEKMFELSEYYPEIKTFEDQVDFVVKKCSLPINDSTLPEIKALKSKELFIEYAVKVANQN